MKLYIFITGGITLVGGAELYIKNKTSYLKEKGWDVIVISSRKGTPIINELKAYEKYIDECFSLSPFFFTKRRRNNILNNMIELIAEEYAINLYDNIVVESSSQYLSLWGEMLAKTIGAKHILFFLLEKYHPASDSLANFYNYKLKRRELACIRKQGIQMLLANAASTYIDNLVILVASGGMPTADYDSEKLNIINVNGHTILILGRLEKPYVSFGIDSIVSFVKRHADNMFTLIIVGENPPELSGLVGSFSKKLDSCKNLKYYFTGNLYPIPIKLFAICDICIACSGSATIAAYNGVPTITLDSVDNKAIGFLGYSTYNNIFRKDEPKIEIVDLLEQGIFYKHYGSFARYNDWKKEKERYYSFDCFEAHLEFASRLSEKEIEYYDFKNTKNLGRDRLLSLCVRLLGYKITNKLRVFFRSDR